MFLLCVSVASSAQAQQPTYEPAETIRVRLKPILDGLLSAWDKYDVVCLGEDHGSKNDSDLRIALVQQPDFARKVKVIIVESASVSQQPLLDRFIVDGESMTRDQLRPVWGDAHSSEVWDSPIYEAFFRAVQKVNLKLPREQRVRILGGDDPKNSNRGRFIREEVSRQILDKNLKGLAIYGAGHCECRGGGFPGEIGDKYPGRIWSAFTFYDLEEGKRVLGLGDEPKLIPISGTDRAKLPAGKIFFTGRFNDASTLGDFANAIVYFGNIKDSKVPTLR
jgi:hypothetical protein